MSIDIESLITTFLRGQDEVTGICGDRIYTDMPHARTYPLVIVNRTGGGSLYKNFLEAAEVDISAYGGTRKTAFELAQACMSTMAADLCGEHAQGVVTKIRVAATAYEPEPESTDQSGHARPRFTVNATVTAHP
jgi:hypothetical protein